MAQLAVLTMSNLTESSARLAQQREDQLISGNLRRIFLLIYRIVGNVPDAQDLTQEVFIKALQRRDQLRNPDKAAHWLSRIASNTAIDFLRRHGRVSLQELDALPDPFLAAPELSPEQLILRDERKEFLERGLRTLTARERAALILRDVEDLPADEVARQLGCSQATVRSHIANARIKFRRYLEKRKQRP